MASAETQLLEVGTKVKFKEAFLARHSESERRFQGRVGEVTGYRAGANEPIVVFPKDGRRKEVKLFEVCLNRIEIVD